MPEDRESRILVVSATLDQAKAAVKRTFCDCLELHLNISDVRFSVAVIKLFVDDSPADLPPSTVDIPWTIKNKYYSADVHFHLVEYAYWDPQLAFRVPAIIFVWARGQVIPFSNLVDISLSAMLALCRTSFRAAQGSLSLRTRGCPRHSPRKRTPTP